MKSTIVDPRGTVRCPVCGATSLTPQRTTRSKVGFSLLSLLAAPKLRCNGCGTFLKPGHAGGIPVVDRVPVMPDADVSPLVAKAAAAARADE